MYNLEGELNKMETSMKITIGFLGIVGLFLLILGSALVGIGFILLAILFMLWEIYEAINSNKIPD